jgi:hypothetical protein
MPMPADEKSTNCRKRLCEFRLEQWGDVRARYGHGYLLSDTGTTLTIEAEDFAYNEDNKKGMRR